MTQYEHFNAYFTLDPMGLQIMAGHRSHGSTVLHGSRVTHCLWPIYP